MESMVRARINDELKSDATTILNACGLNISTAIRLFLEQVVINQGLPFEVTRKPSARLLEAIEQVKVLEATQKTRFNNIDEMIENLNDGK